MRVTDNYVFFWDGIFSNWHFCNFTMVVENEPIMFNTAEQALMFIKAKFFRDEDTARKILTAKSPRTQKTLGREVKNYDDNKWSKFRLEVMKIILEHKFKQNEDLLQALLDTDSRILVEASPYDTIWGIGMRETDIGVEDRTNWRGLNLLGEALTKTRAELRQQQVHPDDSYPVWNILYKYGNTFHVSYEQYESVEQFSEFNPEYEPIQIIPQSEVYHSRSKYDTRKFLLLAKGKN